jgi:transglutaminase-like putative cysteine protease
MTRRRWRITLLGALATLTACYPVTSLFTEATWFGQAVVVVSVVAAVGLVLRGLTRSRTLVVALQVLVLGTFLVVRVAGGTFAYLVVPTVQTAEVLNGLGLQALETVQRYTAPAPLNDGVTFCMLVVVAVVAISVDATAATWRSPAAAGLPLLTAYLITAANGDSALALRYFVVPVALWLVMLHTTARAQFGRWGTARPAEHSEIDEAAHDRAALRSFSGAAVRVGAAGVVLALAVPAVVPHFPPRYLTEGLGRSGVGGEGSVGFNNTLDLSRSLNDTNQSPVLRYTTTGFTRPPLRVLATSYYSRGQWQELGTTDKGPVDGMPLPPPSQRRDYVISVTGNTLSAPRVAAPFPVVAVSMPGTGWRIDPATRDVRVDKAVADYQITYADIAPSAAQLRDSGPPDPADLTDDDLTIPDRSRALIERWSAEVTAGADNPLDKAIAIQNHLRDTSRYTYTLDLGEPLRDEAGRLLEPIENFYRTRRGYCVQFATAMIMMARAQGIPARMAIGFLPGNRSGDEYVVKASDAHAWPELYFQGYGWLRFEPTPGARSGTPPPYAVVGAGSGGTGGGRSVDDTESGSTARPTSTRATTTTTTAVAAQPSFGDTLASVFSLRHLAVVLAVLIGLLAAFVMPLTAWLLRARRRRAAVTRQDLIEAEWEALTSHLGDLGLSAPDGVTLRQLRHQYVTEGHLDTENATAMGRVTATLEKSRYDRPERTTPQEAIRLHSDIRAIRRNVGRTRAWQTRLRSFFWPAAGVEWWRGLPARLGSRTRRR